MVEILNDAKVYREDKHGVLDTSVTVGMTRQGADTKHWTNITGTVGELLGGMLSKYELGTKDGTALLQGEAIDGRRTKTAMRDMRLIMLDHDTGQPFKELLKNAWESGLFTVLWKTYSDGTTKTQIKQDLLMKEYKLSVPSEITNKLVKKYLTEVKGFNKKVVKKCKVVDRIQTAKGIEIVIKHSPITKARSLRVLKEPFDFMQFEGSQNDAMTYWRNIITGVATEMDAEFDKACLDPSRLMYTPRRAPDSDAEQFEIVVINGDFLDLDKITPVEPARRHVSNVPSNPYTDLSSKGGNGNKFETANLMRFAALYKDSFRVADWLEEVAPDMYINHKDDGTGIHFECPNMDMHSTHKDGETSFLATNAEDNPQQSGFSLLCLHETCKDMSGGDRLWYLDRLCQTLKIDDAMSLSVYADRTEDEIVHEEIKDEVEDLDPQSDEDRIELTIKKFAESPAAKNELKTASFIANLSKQTGFGRIPIKKLIRAYTPEQEEDDEDKINPRIPTNEDRDTMIVKEGWNWEEQGAALLRCIGRDNQEKRDLYRITGTSQKVMVADYDHLAKKDSEKDGYCSHVLTRENLGGRLMHAVKFMKTYKDQEPKTLPLPGSLLDYALSCVDDTAFPPLDRIVHVPVFSASGKLQTEQGYNDETQLLLHFSKGFEALSISDTPSGEEVDEALEILLDNALHSFPFADGTPEEAGKRPHKGDEPYDPTRGVGSRANALAMILQPFCREMIDGPTPAYHIDKSTPGTGANYLVDVLTIPFTGDKAHPKPLSPSNEEARKVITASLLTGKPIQFFDNINHKIDSGELASALTAGTWEDRILGSSEIVTIPVKAQWIFAGNNMSLSDELTRRMVPIHMDADHAQPQYRGKEWFKHFPIQKYCLDHRAEMVWACHTLIQNWIAKGQKKGSLMYNSFDSWASTMSGILESCNVYGLMSNAAHYVETRNMDKNNDANIMEMIYEAAKINGKIHGFTSQEATSWLTDYSGDEKSWFVEFEGCDKFVKDRGRLLSNHMVKNMLGRTYNVNVTTTGKKGKVKTEAQAMKLLKAATKRSGRIVFTIEAITYSG